MEKRDIDVEGRISLHEHICTLKNKGKTILLASHAMAEVENLCDSIAILKDGLIAFTGTVAELTEKVGTHYNVRVKTSQGEKDFEVDNIEGGRIVCIFFFISVDDLSALPTRKLFRPGLHRLLFQEMQQGFQLLSRVS